jgi:hypothetical protein
MAYNEVLLDLGRASALCMLTLYAVKNYDFSPEKGV